MTYIEQPKEEGESKDCPNCKKPIVARLKEYKDYPNKIQWQDKDQTKAHYDKDGNCKAQTTESPLEQTTIPESTIQKLPPAVNLLDEVTKKLIKNEATLLYHIRNEVENTIKAFETDPHGGMIGQFTELIWRKYFSDKE